MADWASDCATVQSLAAMAERKRSAAVDKAAKPMAETKSEVNSTAT